MTVYLLYVVFYSVFYSIFEDKTKKRWLFHAPKTGIWTTFGDNDVATFTGLNHFETLLVEFVGHAAVFFYSGTCII